MFRVENADFIADKLAAELLPYQEFREVLKNAEEAIRRRIAQDGDSGGRIEFDVDWHLLQAEDRWFISCSDDGDGMSRAELERYMTTLAVQGANRNQSLVGNQGMGLKISGPTRHRKGVLIRSMKAGERSMVQIGWDETKGEYDLIPLRGGRLITSVAEEAFPDFVRRRGSGTVVTFLGNSDEANTFAPADQVKGWLFSYLHRRFFELSHDGIHVFVRVPSGTQENWPRTRDETDALKTHNLQRVRGTARVWTKAAQMLGDDYYGVVRVPGDPRNDIPPAKVHWWVLPLTGSDVSSRTYSPGSLAVLFQNELHDWRVGAQANPYFGRMGVIYGKNRIGFVLEPLGGTITSDFARAHVLVNGTPVLEHEASHLWAEQFRSDLPEAIKKTMAEEQARLAEEDPQRARRIRDRLTEVLRLLRPRKFKLNENGDVRAAGPDVTGPGDGEQGKTSSTTRTAPYRDNGGRRGIGAVLSQLDEEGEPATEIFSVMNLEPHWVTEEQAETSPIVNGNGQGLRDRAAALAGEDAASAPVLLLNVEFRGYQSLLAALNEWANPEGDSNKAARVEDAVREWVEQKMIEAIQGLRQLENGSSWLTGHFNQALSPVGLTAVFMADRYHTLSAVKRSIGNIRT